MSRFIGFWLAIGAMLCSMTGCMVRQPGYLTLTPSTPAIARWGEARAFGTVGLNHVEGQIAGSPLPHLTLFANGYASNGSRSQELGIGSYVRLGEHLLLDAALFQTKSRINTKDTLTSFSLFGSYLSIGSVDAAYDGLALQTNISYGFFEREHDWQPTITAGVKIHDVTYHYYQHFRGYQLQAGSPSNGKQWTMPAYMMSERFYTISITGRGGTEHVGVMGQLAFHSAVGRYKPRFIEKGPGYKFFWLTTGVEIYISPKNSKIRRKSKSTNT